MLFFLIGPLHGPGLWEWFQSSPGAALGYMSGVIFHGLAYSWIRYRSDNVLLCAILHGLINGPMNSAGLVIRAHGL
jgi:membrane protease YdiL (CAAX protease family)